MYVIYPASRLVGLTINYREINQLRPFPPRNPSEEEPEDVTEKVTPDRGSESTLRNAEIIRKDPGRSGLGRSVNSLASGRSSPAVARSKSESPRNRARFAQGTPRNDTKKLSKIVRCAKYGNTSDKCLESPVENRETDKIVTLEENLKNFEISHRGAKPIFKNSWNLHFKKSVTSTDIIKMAALECTLKDMTHPALNETLKAHNAVTFKLVKTVSEFTESLAHMYEQHAEEMQLLVSNFRKKNSELRKERPACPSSLFHTWETLLQEVEIDSQAHTDIASILGRQVSRPLLEKSFFRKIQSRKVFSHREAYENLIKQNEDKLSKARIEYKTAYLAYMNSPSSQALANYINSHNEYVSQLHLTNGMLGQYHSKTLPMLLQEIEDIYSDLCAKMSDSVLQGAEMISSRAQEQARRYEGLITQCRVVQGPTDLTHLVRSVTIPPNQPPIRRHFTAPQPPQPQEGPDGQPLPVDPNVAANMPPLLKNEIVVDRLASIQMREKLEAIKKECVDLEAQIKQLTDALHTLTRVQQRSVDSNLFNKVNELQEDINVKQYELNVALITLAGIRAQRELFSNKVESAETGRDRKMSASSTGSMKSKWMKAFKSLKTPPSNGSSAKESEKKNGKDGAASFISDSTAHTFQDYTYKKITPCDVCSQVLRGHTRQGLKCRVCKLNVHVDCQDKAPKCQQKSRLLRRQKSTSEIDTKVHEPHQEEETQPKKSTPGTRQVHYDLGSGNAMTERTSPSATNTNMTKSRTLSQSNLDPPAETVDQVYQVLKQASDLSSKSGNPNRNLQSSESYQIPNTNPSPPQARGDYYMERAPSLERKNEYYYGKQQPQSQQQKGYGRSEYQTSPDYYKTGDFYQSSPPKTYKNRLSDPGVIQTNNAACLGPSAGTATPGTTCNESVSQSRRQQGPLLLRGTTQLSVGPVPYATSSDEMDTAQRRRLFSGFKSFSVFGGKTRGDSPSHRSISLPENAERTRPFGQPLFLGASVQENGGLTVQSGNQHQNQPQTTPHSPRRQKLNLRMKSLSLDSPESTEQAQKRRAQATHSGGHSSQSSSSKIHSPSSPVHSRRLLSARNMRMSSVELPDDNEKSLSSASTSPCPSPKPHRLLPTNLYVVLYNFKSRHPDELDLKAGYKVTVMDNSDPDWWKGKCLGRVGYFPSKYVIKLEPGERPLQVTHNLQVQDGDSGLMLLRDQIVIQVGEDIDGMVMIRNVDNKQGACPLKFLQEV